MHATAQIARKWGSVLAPLALTVALVLASSGPGAVAVTSRGQPTTTVAPDTSGSGATYTFGTYKGKNEETVSSASVTFPAGTDVASATAVSPAGTVSVSGQTVTVTFATPIPAKSTFTVTMGNIVNPAAGTYNAGPITFQGTLRGNPNTSVLRTGDYTITAGYLTMTITTPDAGQSVDFGTLDPGIASTIETVIVQVDSSGPYTLARTLGGDATALGLNITGDATGAKPAGNSIFTDLYQLTPSWTATPSIPLTATVLYTAIQG
jgi:hypothetical protein